MESNDRRTAIMKIAEMPAEKVLKVLIFMAGMEAGEAIKESESQKSPKI